jgi:hypothetical protein
MPNNPYQSRKVIISDTGPLISLEKITAGFLILQKLYDVILIPPEVLSELSKGLPNGTNYLEKYSLQDFIKVEDIELPTGTDSWRLHNGEKYAIALALKYQLPILLEERRGRMIAIQQGLKVSGIIGQLDKATKIGILNPTETLQKIQELYKFLRISNKMLLRFEEEYRIKYSVS